ncbi:MAG: 2-C-methyl-D-erythritol 4-phosphate cytidylyltransferase [Candidatus Muirbacterium halophilum]|nr:2-C-methyl-D-erythritol 4-phosphate cytidylyltransferase [Candidatus Muirbacterium halophilum]MCK9474649.1 2-C-methyl-D-erythritol 4-phosphate cytidylyltransferase [Candidatus Muirbacterium halophilum]
MNIAVILAGGKGKRMNMKGSKQLFKINGKEVFKYSLDVFCNNPLISHIIVVYNKDYKEEFEKINLLKNVSIIECGKERWESSFNALKFINKEFPNCKKVFIHDGARPFIDAKLIKRLFDNCTKDIAIVPGIPLKDTVKQIDKDGFVVCTPDRNSLVCVQTPQLFDFKTLYNLYEKTNFNLNKVTDDSSVWELYGKKVKIICGNLQNIKITTKEDIEIASLYAKDYNL